MRLCKGSEVISCIIANTNRIHPKLTLTVLDQHFELLVRVDFIALKFLPKQALQLLLYGNHDGYFSVSPKITKVRMVLWHVLNREKLGYMRSELDILFCRAYAEGYCFPTKLEHRDAFISWWKDHPNEYLPRFGASRMFHQFKQIGKTLEKLINEAAEKGDVMEISDARKSFKMLMGRSPEDPEVDPTHD